MTEEKFELETKTVCSLIIGKVKDLNKTKLSCFENYRNELRSISIITFDEILTKLELMLGLLEMKILLMIWRRISCLNKRQLLKGFWIKI